MSDTPPLTVRVPGDPEAAEFRSLGLTPGNWAALTAAPLFRPDLRSPERGDFKTLHAFRQFVRTLPALANEAEVFWARLGRKEVKGEGLEIAYALLGWHLAKDMPRTRREEFLALLDRTAQSFRRQGLGHGVPVERDVRRWVEAYFSVVRYTRNPPLPRIDPPDPVEVARLLGPELWKQLLAAPIAAALVEQGAHPPVAQGVVGRLTGMSEASPLAQHLNPVWLGLFGPILNGNDATPGPLLDDAIRVAAQGLATLVFDEREKIVAAIRREIRQAVVASDRDAVAAGWIDRVREEIETVLRGGRPVGEPVLAKLVRPVEWVGEPAWDWQCTHCGIENPPTAPRCVACGSPGLPPLVLRSATTRKEESYRSTRRLGRADFATALGDPDAAFASDAQFEVVRDEAAGAWVLRPLPGAWNPTYYNGALVAPDGVRLTSGGVISIGKSRLKLEVQLNSSDAP